MRRATSIMCLLLGVLTVSSCRRVPDVSQASLQHALPRIDPDYTSVVIPPNIAPMNFRIREPGQDFLVRLSPEAGEGIELHCPDGTCRIPRGPWRKLLASSKGGSIRLDVFAEQGNGMWTRFSGATMRVASEPIDSYIVYRVLSPNRAYSRIKGIFQRDLESFERSALITRRGGTFSCFNCHTFYRHNPDKFLYHVRGNHAGMMVVADGKIRKIETRQDPMFRPLAYAAWHPDGRHVAATLNMYRSLWPATGERQHFEAVEKRGDLVVYDVEQNTIHTTREVFDNTHIETHPCWSADGRHIYFVRCKDRPLLVAADLPSFKFDLVRIACDVETGAWGEPEMVKAYSENGASCSFPRPSSCGRYVLHILSDQTTYPIHQDSSDLYLLDLETGEHARLDRASSDRSESYPRWSSNGRWFSFLSNRRDGVCALPYFAYFDEQGQAHKAFVLPQEDPAYYDTFIDTYNGVEMVKSKVRVRPDQLARGMQQKAVQAQFPNPPDVDAYTGATQKHPPTPGGHY